MQLYPLPGRYDRQSHQRRVFSLPTIMLGLVVVAAVGSSIPVLILTAGVIYATVVFRLARSLGQEIMVMDFVEAARVRGEGRWWIITREIWPNAAMPLRILAYA